MYPQDKEALSEIRSALAEKYPETFVALYAFGSRVRGDHDEGSDFDVMVVVSSRTIEIEEGILDVFLSEEERSGRSFDPVIKTSASLELEARYNTPFFESFSKESVAI